MKKIYYAMLISLLLFSTSTSWAAGTIKVASIFAVTGDGAIGSTATIAGIKFAVQE